MNIKHGLSKTRSWCAWSSARARCGNPAHENYHNYGGRGIRVCERWHVFAAFFADMGHPPPGSSLDRIDNTGNYEPGNCRWATMKEQGRNKRTVKLNPDSVLAIRALIGFGLKQREIAGHFGVHQSQVSDIKRGEIWAA